jgi:dTDP-4-dehydrorhamnose 3,5-epimerase
LKILTTSIENLLVLEPKVFGDNRGYFFESYSYNELKDFGLDIKFIQDNEAFSAKGVLRGLHFQKPPYAQTKLIRVISGEILDVVVDLRKNSETYGKSYSINLNSENKRQLLVPKGFAHGYQVVSDEAIVAYKVDEVYNPSSEGGLMYNDEDLAIEWVKIDSEIKIAEKDLNLECFDGFKSPF